MQIQAYAIVDKEYQKGQYSDFFHSDPVTKFVYMPTEKKYKTSDYILSKTLHDAEEKADFITSNTGQEVEIKEVVITIKEGK